MISLSYRYKRVRVRVRRNAITSMFVLGVFVVIGTYWLMPKYLLSQHPGSIGDAGAHGDVYGAVNALFTSLAFALLIYTALMQREELKLQREELKLTRNEIKKSAEAQNELVRITNANDNFQRSVRRNQIRTEFTISKGHGSRTGWDDFPFRTDIEIKVKYNPMQVIQIDPHLEAPFEFGNQQKIYEQYYYRILEPGTGISLFLKHRYYDDMKTLIINLAFRDVDGGTYYQVISGRLAEEGDVEYQISAPLAGS